MKKGLFLTAFLGLVGFSFAEFHFSGGNYRGTGFIEWEEGEKRSYEVSVEFEKYEDHWNYRWHKEDYNYDLEFWFDENHDFDVKYQGHAVGTGYCEEADYKHHDPEMLNHEDDNYEENDENYDYYCFYSFDYEEKSYYEIIEFYYGEESKIRKFGFRANNSTQAEEFYWEEELSYIK